MSEMQPPNAAADLQRIHRVITRGLSVAQDNCDEFAVNGFPDATTAEGFWKYCQGLEANIRGHHLTEDDLIFPFLRERISDLDFDDLMADHEEMDVFLAEMVAAREAGSPSDLGDALSKMADLWHPHIGKEEAGFTPERATEVMTAPETINLAQKAAALAQEHAQPAPLAVPFVLYNAEGDDRAFYLAVMPPEVTQNLVPVVWKDVWAPMKPFLLD
jgi:hypothetical protein